MPTSSFLIQDPPDLALVAVSNVERAVRRLRDAVRAEDRAIRIRSCEPRREELVVTARLAAGKLLKHDVVAVLRQRRAVPGSVERDERAVGRLQRRVSA